MILKYLIPFTAFTFESPLSLDEARLRLSASTEPKRYFRFFDYGDMPFEGYISQTDFRINRLIRYRNSFLPVIIGRFEARPTGCKINIHMRMIVLICAFCLIWLSGLVFVGGAFLSRAFNKGAFQWTDLMPIGMLIFFMTIINGGFWFEAIKQKRMLADIFKTTA